MVGDHRLDQVGQPRARHRPGRARIEIRPQRDRFLAVEIDPEYAYGGTTSLGAYDLMARQGPLDPPATEEALARSKSTGQCLAGLGESDIAHLERRVD
jgi:hypothetical protein